MKTFIAVFIIFCSVAISVGAIDIDKTELGKSQGHVEFENNPNPVSGNASVDQIREIGKTLAKALFDSNGGRKQNVVVGDSARYYMKEISDTTTRDVDGLSADIIMLGSLAGVDTITNLRRILSGYIEDAYRYPREIADEIAVYVTVYNAINRKTLDRFSEFYKPAVTRDLKADILGLSSSYREWPGATQIIIPLYDPDSDGDMVIEVKEIVNEAVVAAMKKEPVKGANPEKFKAAPPPPPPPTKQQLQAKARAATTKAENELREYERALAEAQQRALVERQRQKSLEDSIAIATAEFEKTSANIVKNKFGEPIVGNEAYSAKQAEIAALKKSLASQGGRIRNADTDVVTAEKRLEAKRAELEQRKLDEAELL
jgi:hypothetical protein